MLFEKRKRIDKYIKKKPKLSKYCRYMLGILLDLKIDENTKIESVKVWKEWQYIDLCVEAIIKKGETTYHYALLIENKYYSKLHDNQLKRYKEVFDTYYKKKETRFKWRLRHKLVSCLERQKQVDEMYAKELKDTKFKALPFYKLICPDYWDKDALTYTDSESDIFNEFWLRKW